MWYSYLIPPFVGAVIGYFTNELAIKMLFRPFRPKYILGVKVPFTPGIIPKEKERLAQSIGQMVSLHLMDKDTLEKNLLSDEMFAKVAEGIDRYIEQIKSDDALLRDSLSRYMADVDASSQKLSAEFSLMVGQRIVASNLGKEISVKVVQYIVERTSNSPLGFIGADKLLDKVSDHLEEKLAKHIDTILQEHSEGIVRNMSEKELSNLLERPVSELVADKDALMEKGRAMALNLYRMVISERLPKMLDTIDVQKIVESRINEMDISEVERITYQVMDRELKSIVWLGALLGGILGLVNLLFV